MSRMTSVAILDTRLLLDLKGCTELLRFEALRDACREFCEETGAWHEELTLDLVDGQVRYNLIPSFDAHVYRLVDVWKLTEDQVTDGVRGDALGVDLYDLTAGDPEVLVLADTIEPEDDVTNGLIVKAAMVPEFNSADIAEWFLNRYWLAIVSRAKAIRMLDDKTRWTNAQKAAINQGIYLNEVQKAKAEVSRAFKEGPVTLPM